MIPRPADDAITARCILDSRDHLAAIRALARGRSTLSQRFFRGLAIVALMIVCAYLAFAPMTGPPEGAKPSDRYAMMRLYACLFAFGVVLLGRPVLARIHAHFAGKAPEERRTLSWTIDRLGLSHEAAEGVTRYPWDFWSRILETERSFFLVRDEQNYSFIPTRAFPDAPTMDPFAALARERAADYVQSRKARYPADPLPVDLGDS